MTAETDVRHFGTAGRLTRVEIANRLPRLRWYARRLSAMSAPELLHRVQDAARQRLWGMRDGGWNAFASVDDGALADWPGLRARLAHVPVWDAACPAAVSLGRFRDGGLTFFGRPWPSGALADPSVWFHDPITGHRWPGAERSAFAVDVRSTGEAIGDVKFVWEPNRLQILHPLAAAAAQGGTEARAAGLALLRAWAAANPPYRGVNWVSGIELGLRLVGVALFIAAVEPDTLLVEDRRLLRRLVAAHARHLAAFRSKYSSANNHLVAEGLGLLVAGLLTPDLSSAAAWEREGRRILEAQALALILPDGVGAEQSLAYQAFTLEMIAFGALLAGEAGRPLGASVIQRLAAGAEHLLWLMDETGHAPAIGDDDESRVVAQPPDPEPRYLASVVAAVAGLTGRPDLAPPARDPHLRDVVFGSPEHPGVRPRGVRVFRDGGYTVAHEAVRGRFAHLVFDHGPLGLAPLAAHGHADALAIWLSVDGQPVFIDAGTYLYFSGRDLRVRLRESPAHNTLSLAGASQSRAAPGFGWTSQAHTALRAFMPGPEWSSMGAHDGYRARFDVTHVRQVRRTPTGYRLADRLEGAHAALPVTIDFLCDPGLDLVEEGGAVLIRSGGDTLCRVHPPKGFGVRLARASSDRRGDRPVRSRRFGSLEPASRITLVGSLGSDAAETVIEIAPGAARSDGARLEASLDRHGGLRRFGPEASHSGTRGGAVLHLKNKGAVP